MTTVTTVALRAIYRKSNQVSCEKKRNVLRDKIYDIAFGMERTVGNGNKKR
jgi:hypothetical protein